MVKAWFNHEIYVNPCPLTLYIRQEMLRPRIAERRGICSAGQGEPCKKTRISQTKTWIFPTKTSSLTSQIGDFTNSGVVDTQTTPSRILNDKGPRNMAWKAPHVKTSEGMQRWSLGIDQVFRYNTLKWNNLWNSFQIYQNKSLSQWSALLLVFHINHWRLVIHWLLEDHSLVEVGWNPSVCVAQSRICWYHVEINQDV